MKQVQVAEYMKNIKGMIKYDQPNMDMRNFNARLKLESYPRASAVLMQNFILRGSSLKNTKCIYGLVVYTGMDSKIMQILKPSAKNKSFKNSKQERNFLFVTMNLSQILFLVFYITIVIIYVINSIYKFRLIEEGITNISSYVNSDKNKEDIYYSIYQFILTFYLVIPYNWFNLIYITYFIISKFIEYDVKVKLSSRNTTEIINTDCLGDFGQVKYIVADKTGTITSRKFDLKGLTFKGKFYSLENSERKDEGLFKEDITEINELEIYNDIKSRNLDSMEIREFIEELAINHSLTTWKTNVTPNNDILSSFKPDVLNSERKMGSAFCEEKALMKVLESMGYVLKKASENRVEVDVVSDKRKIFEILGRNKYTSTRKCSSLIYKKHHNDTESIMLCKSYDISSLEKVKYRNIQFLQIQDQINKMSNMGYRYVIILKKNLSEEETNNFIENYKSAQSNMLQKEQLLEKLAKETEQDIEVVGALFFEEYLSPGLKFSLSKLNLADIHTWIISGDRSSNVEAVAKNLDVFTSMESDILNLHEKMNRDDLELKINDKLVTLHGNNNVIDKWAENKTEEVKKTVTIFIHGKTMSIIMKNNRLYQQFALLLIYTGNLFASGFTAKNKYQLVSMMKKYLCHNCKVLAIGDGLNDVMMLKEADLSIGIRSREILQVKNTCDLIISQFSQITDLILIHGTWNLKRIISITYYSLYSHLTIILPFLYNEFFNNMYSNLDPDYLYLVLSLIILNLSITIAYCFNNHVDRSLISIAPHVYSDNFKGKYHSRLLAFTILQSIVDSSIIFYGYYLFSNTCINNEGFTLNINIQWLSYLIPAYIIIYSKLLFIEMNCINIVNFSVILMSAGGVFCIAYIRNNTFIDIKDLLSFLPLLIFYLGVSLTCVLISFAINMLIFFFKNNITNNLIKEVSKATSNLSYLLDYEGFIKKITDSVFPNEKLEYTKFEDIVKVITDDNFILESTIENMIDTENNKILETKLKWDLSFKNRKMEIDYSNYFKSQNILCFFYYLVAKFLFLIVYLIVESSEHKIEEIKITLSVQFGYILVGLLLFLSYFKKNFYSWFIVYFYIDVILNIILIYIEDSNNDTKSTIQFIVTLLYPTLFGIRYIYYITFGIIIHYAGIFASLFISRFEVGLHLTVYGYILHNLPLILTELLYITSTIVIMFLFGYYTELQNRINFIKFEKKLTDKRKDDEIFDNLVPKFVQNKMKTGDRGTTNEKETVTIIFANIAKFDDLVAKLNPRELVSLLDKIYGSFDKLSFFHGIQKIETVAYTYMAAGGISECEKDMDENCLVKHHAIRAYELALDMVEIISSIVLENGESVKIKIGIHTGKVLAGVIGEHKPQFSLIGDTVNTAARMGSKVAEMCILMTEESWSIVNTEYPEFEVLTKNFKGKGDMKCYQSNPISKKTESKNAKMLGFKRFLTKFLSRAIESTGGGADFNLQELLASNNKPQKPAPTRKNSIKSNQSEFIIEDDNVAAVQANFEYEENLNHRKNKLIYGSTSKDKNLVVVSNASEVNPLFQKSILLFYFNTKNEEEDKHEKFIDCDALYKKYSLMKFYNSLNSTTKLNYCFIVVSIIALLNNSEYNDSRFDGEEWNTLLTLLKLILILFMFLIVGNINNWMKNGKYKIEISFFILYLIYICFCQLKFSLLDKEFYLQIATEQNFVLVLIGFNYMIEYKRQLVLCLSAATVFLMNILANTEDYIKVKYSALSIGITFCIIIFIILREYIGTFDYVKNQEVTTELLKAEKLLFNLMPPHVVQSLKEDRTVADEIKDVTILYTDIKNFTKFSAAQKDQSNIVRMLIQLFKRMDNACVELNVYKVHTIGDCFVVLGFTGKVSKDLRNPAEEAYNVVMTGKKMIEIIKTVRETKEVNFPELDMRIGIHTGKLIAGIIGSSIVRYDIFGSDCLVANLMESEGVPGRVNVSEDTKKILGIYFKFRF